MVTFGENPFGILMFIVAPAILTNASSIMTLGTSNRFARAIDRARSLSAQLDANPPGLDVELQVRMLRSAEKRSLLLVRALTAFYLSLGSFAAASLVSILGAVFFISHNDVAHRITQLIALFAGVVAVGGLMTGSALLVLETRLTLRVLREETTHMLKKSSGISNRPGV